MNVRILVICILMFLLGSAVTALYLYLVGSDTLQPTNTVSVNRVTNRSDAIDRHFIEQMIPHHEDALIMARLAFSKAHHPEIKTLATNINRTQSAEISEMREWYKKFYGTAVPENTQMMHPRANSQGLSMGMMGNGSYMQSLKNADDFDKTFIEQMIPHHQMAVMMATMLLTSTDRDEMKTLARNIIDAQTKEITAMRSWYAAWYE